MNNTKAADEALSPVWLHTMLRVTDLNQSLDFYACKLGMSILNRTDYPSAGFTLVFLGFNGQARLELTWNWDAKPYRQGTAFGHIAIGVPDLYGLCEKLTLLGVTIIRSPGPMKNGPDELIAFVLDPDGYTIELIQTR